MILKTITLIALCIATICKLQGWSAYADSAEEEQFQVYLNAVSSDINPYIRELAGKLNKDLLDKPFLRLNQTALNGIRGRVYLAAVVDKISSKYLVKFFDIKSKNKDIDSDESYSDSSSEEE